MKKNIDNDFSCGLLLHFCEKNSDMRKIFLLALVLGSFSSVSFAQVDKSFYRSSYESRNNGTFDQSTSLISFGYGFPNATLPGYGVFNGVSKFSLGPIYAKYEHGFLRDEVGLGGQIAFSTAWIKYDNGGTRYSDNVTAFHLAILGYYHFNKLIPVKKLDVYAGAGFSVRSVAYSYDDDYAFNADSYTETNPYFVVKVGVRYYFTPSFALYAETGYDNMSSLNLGVTFRM
jgi:hypothetical protein